MISSYSDRSSHEGGNYHCLRTMPLSPSVASDTFQNILSRNDFHRQTSQSSNYSFRTRSVLNEDLNQSDDLRALAAQDYGAVTKPTSKSRSKHRAKKNEAVVKGAMTRIQLGQGSGKPKASKSNERRQSQGRPTLTEMSLKQSVRKYERKVVERRAQSSSREQSNFNTQRQEKLPMTESQGTNPKPSGKKTRQELKFKAKDFKLMARVIQGATKRKEIAPITQSSNPSSNKRKNQPFPGVSHSGTVTFARGSVCSQVSGGSKRNSNRPRVTSGRLAQEFSFRPNTPYLDSSPNLEDILQSCQEVFEELGNFDRQSQFISLVEKLSKLTEIGLTWEKALQIVMIKTHMQAKAMMFYQKTTKRKFLARMVAAFLRNQAQKQEDQLPQKDSYIYVDELVKQAYALQECHDGENCERNTDRTNTTQDSQEAKPKLQTAEFASSTPTLDYVGYQKREFKKIVPERPKIESKRQSIPSLMKLMNKSLKQLIVQREQQIRSESQDIVKGPEDALMAVERLINKSQTFAAFANWKRTQEQYSLAADDFRYQVLCSKAWQGFGLHAENNKVARTVYQKIFTHCSARLLSKSLWILRAHAYKRKERKQRLRLAGSLYAQRLLDRALISWKQFSFRDRFTLEPIDSETRQFITSARFNELSETLHDTTIDTNIVACEKALLSERCDDPQRVKWLLKKAFKGLQRYFLLMMDFKSKIVERTLRSCLVRWHQHAWLRRMKVADLQQRLATNFAKMVLTGWRNWAIFSKEADSRAREIRRVRQIRAVFNHMRLCIQHSRSRRDIKTTALLFYFQKVSSKAFGRLQKYMALSRRIQTEADNLRAICEASFTGRVMRHWKMKAEQSKKAKQLWLKSSNRRGVMKETFESWRQVSVIYQSAKKFRLEKLLQRALRAQQDQVQRSKRESMLIKKFEKMQVLRVKYRCVQALKWVAWLASVTRLITVRANQRHKDSRIKTAWKSLKTNVTLQRKQREQRALLSQTSERQTKSKVMQAMKKLIKRSHQVNLMVHQKNQTFKRETFKSLHRACQLQGSLRARFIDFAYNRLKSRCLDLFTFWSNQALVKQSARESLTQRQHYFSCKMALHRIKKHAQTAIRYKSASLVITTSHDLALKRQVLQYFVNAARSDGAKRRKQAKQHRVLVLLTKALRGLYLRVQRSRELSQIAHEREERVKQRYIRLWSSALFQRFSERAAISSMVQFRKRQTLLKLRLNLRQAKEKALKNEAARAFQSIWCKRLAFDGIIKSILSYRQRASQQHMAGIQMLQKRQQKVLVAWSGLTKLRKRRAAFNHLIASNHKLYALRRFFTAMRAKVELSQRLARFIQKREIRLFAKASFALKMLVQQRRMQEKLAVWKSDRKDLKVKQRVFQSFFLFSSLQRAKKAAKVIAAGRKAEMKRQCLRAIQGNCLRQFKLRVASKRLRIKHVKNLKRAVLRRIIKAFEKSVYRRQKQESLLYAEEQTQLIQSVEGIQNLLSRSHFDLTIEKTEPPPRNLRVSMLETANVNNPILQASFYNQASHQSLNRLFRTPVEAKTQGNRLLQMSTEESRVELFTKRINNRLEHRSNRSSSTKGRSRSISDERLPTKEIARPLEASTSRPPLQPPTGRKHLKVFTAESSQSPRSKRVPNLRYQTSGDRVISSETQIPRSFRELTPKH